MSLSLLSQIVGAIVVIAGTLLVIFHQKPETKWTLSERNKKEKKYWRDTVRRAEDGTYNEPRILVTNKLMLWVGLACIIIGSFGFLVGFFQPETKTTSKISPINDKAQPTAKEVQK